MKSEEELKKVEDNIVKFENEGDSVYGVLIAKEKGANFNNDVYKIKNNEGEILTIFSTTILESLMAGVKIGDTCKIVFKGTKPNPKKDRQPIKLFDVYN